MLREARAAQTIKLAAIKYMVLYQLLLALMIHSAFFMDGSDFTQPQVSSLPLAGIPDCLNFSPAMMLSAVITLIGSFIIICSLVQTQCSKYMYVSFCSLPAESKVRGELVIAWDKLSLATCKTT